jgi:two-component system, response regulator PdtaR
MPSISPRVRLIPPPPPLTKPLRIVIAEDEVIVGVLLAEMLEGLGHSVCAIEATELGLVMAATRFRPDLMIVDVRLGSGNGVAAVEHVLQIDFIPHVFISGAAVQVREAGAVVLQKPFWEADIVDAMERALLAVPGG